MTRSCPERITLPIMCGMKTKPGNSDKGDGH